MKKQFLLPIVALGLVGLVSCVDNGGASSAKSTRVRSSRGPVMRNVTFDYNYEGGAADATVEVESRKTVSKPATDPTRAGYKFLGWTTDEAGYSPFDFDTAITSDLTLYAAWEAEGETQTKRYVFEAEYAPSVMDLDGATYSGGANGKQCIGYDYNRDMHASNGFYVHFLYVKYEPARNYGSKLDFNFTAAAQGTMSIIFRLSAEYGQEGQDITVTSDMWKAKLNGTQINYQTLVFKDVPKQGDGNKAFDDFTLAVNVEVKAGENKLEFITDNDVLLQGTAQATAPMIDCLKIKTDTDLTWAEANPNQLPEVE